ncbi:MAG: ketosynthase [Gammaproteobacteria bacterium]
MIALGIVYPLIAHIAVATRSGPVTLATLGVLAALVLLPRLVQRNVVAWVALPVAVAALVFLWRADAEWLPLYVAPVFITLFVAWLFGHTLAVGETPLIVRLVRLLHAPESPGEEIERYARSVTLAWALLLSGLALISLTLALVAVPNGILEIVGLRPPFTVSVETWSLFSNFLDYGIAGGFFLAEYAYRRYRFPQQPYRNLYDFMKRAAAVSHRAIRS